MRILVIGLGRCGSRLADEFCRLNVRAGRERGVEVVTGAFAVSTDTSDMVDLECVKADYRHRMLIGTERMRGAGLNGDNVLGADIMQSEASNVIEEIRLVKQFYSTDAILVIAGASGGMGSGGLPVLVQKIKQRFPDKRVYAMVVLPFRQEETQDPKAVANTAICLKSTAPVADAVILVDNERYHEGDSSELDYAAINAAVVLPYFNILCAGAEKRKKHIGGKLLDAGDIIQTLKGWTVVGSGRTKLPMGMSAIFTGASTRKGGQSNFGVRAMDEALGEVAFICKPADATSALYLVTAPGVAIDIQLVKNLGAYLKNAVPDATIRSGDYPVGRGMMEVTVILSDLRDIARVRDLYNRTSDSPGE